MITDSAYIRTSDLNAILFPNRNDGITAKLREFPEPRDIYLQKIFSERIMFFGKDFSEDDDVSNTYTPLEVRAIICDKNRTQMYLIYKGFDTGLQIPGGPIHKSDIDTPYMDRESILLTSLMGNIIHQLDPVYGESLYNSMKDEFISPRRKLYNVICSKFGGKYNELPRMYFSYILPNTPQRKFIFYYVYEYGSKQWYGDNMMPFSPRSVFPLNKELFRISLRHMESSTISSVIGIDPIDKGVVFEDYGRNQLQTIFNTDNIF